MAQGLIRGTYEPICLNRDPDSGEDEKEEGKSGGKKEGRKKETKKLNREKKKTMVHQPGAATSNGAGSGAGSGPESDAAAAAGHPPVAFIPETYSNTDSDASARRLILALRPDWASADSHIEFVRFTDGITNTLLKAVNRRPGLSKDDVDRDAILLRAYGHGTDLIIDRARETQNHELLMQHGLAPELLARFHNGMLYRFVRGAVTSPEDLRRPAIYLAVARRLAQWHATVPCLPGQTHVSERMNARRDEILGGLRAGKGDDSKFGSLQDAIDGVCPGKQAPNVWTVMQKWILALPTETEAQRERQALLQGELRKLVAELSQRPGLGEDGVSSPAKRPPPPLSLSGSPMEKKSMPSRVFHMQDRDETD